MWCVEGCIFFPNKQDVTVKASKLPEQISATLCSLKLQICIILSTMHVHDRHHGHLLYEPGDKSNLKPEGVEVE